MPKREDLERAIRCGKRVRSQMITQTAPKKAAANVAAAANHKKCHKPNPRSAKARDERSKQRGRLPKWTRWEGDWNGEVVSVTLSIFNGVGFPRIEFSKSGEGLFRACEELDIQFWEWLATIATAEVKARLVWPEKDVKPEPYPKDKKEFP